MKILLGLVLVFGGFIGLLMVSGIKFLHALGIVGGIIGFITYTLLLCWCFND